MHTTTTNNHHNHNNSMMKPSSSAAATNDECYLCHDACSAAKQRNCLGIMMLLGIVMVWLDLVHVHVNLDFNSVTSSNHTNNLKASSSSSSSPVESKEELPHVINNDLKYRRVCSDVYGSQLCIIIRYPFELPLQNPTVPYPKPFDDRIYDLRELIMIDGPLLDDCRYMDFVRISKNDGNSEDTAGDAAATIPMNDRIYQCLEKKYSEHPNAVLAVYTRQVQGQAEEDWFGTGSYAQRDRMYNFFDRNAILILGDSLSPPLSNCVSQLLGNCWFTSKASFHCKKPGINIPPNGLQPPEEFGNMTKDLPDTDYDIAEADWDTTWLGYMWYKPDGAYELNPLVNSTPPLLELFRRNGIVAGPAWTTMTTKLRPLSILVEFPIAHSQHHAMIQTNFAQVKYNQERMVELIMNITTPAGRAELAKLGFELNHLIVFDGIPEHFPTETGAYVDLRTFANEADYVQKGGYPGWRADLGTNCRGPLPPNSPLKRVNFLSRQAFARLATTSTTTVTKKKSFTKTRLSKNNNHFAWEPSKWYGKTWEFSNQFWWQEQMWDSSILDCTHPRSPVGGAVCAHKFFLQAMVDAYYEEKEAAKKRRKWGGKEVGIRGQHEHSNNKASDTDKRRNGSKKVIQLQGRSSSLCVSTCSYWPNVV